MVAPDAFVGNLHPGLALSAGRRQHAVHIDVGHRSQQVAAPPLPQLRAHRVDRLHPFDHVGRLETSTEVPRGRRVGDQVGAQGLHVGRVVSADLDILQPRAAAQRVVAQIQHVVRLVIRQVHLQQVQAPVDLLRQSQLRHQAMRDRNPAIVHHVGVATDLVVHRAGAQHRPGLSRPMSRLRMSGLHAAFPSCTVPPTLLGRNSLHRKGPPCWGSKFLQNPANSYYGKPFRPSRTHPAVPSRLDEG